MFPRHREWMPAPRRNAALYVVVTIGASDGAAPWRLPAFAAAAKTRQWTAFVKAEFRLPAAALSDPVAVRDDWVAVPHS